MSDEPKALRSLFGDAQKAGAGTPRGLSLIDERAHEIAAALRRAVPFLMRKGISLTAEPATVVKASALMSNVKGPAFHVPLATDPGGSRALLVCDAGAVAFLLDAALGGDAESAEPSFSDELTGAQRAAIGRLVEPMVKLLSDVFLGLGVRFRRMPMATGLPTEGELISLMLTIGGREDRKIMLAVSKDALASAGSAVLGAQKRGDAENKVPAILCQVEVELVAELGRVHRKLSAIEGLRVDHVIRLDTPVQAPVTVRIQDKPIFRARPTVSGTQLAVTVLERFDQRKEAPPELRVREIEPSPFEPLREV